MKKILLIALVLAFATSLHAIEVDTAFVKKEFSYVPELAGVIKAKYEVSTNDGYSRFDVRNSRMGVRGHATKNIRYSIMIDYNNEGKISVLDSYAAYVGDGWEVSLGQQRYRFSNNMDRGPNSNIFANRSFIAKFSTSYYGSELSGGKETYYVRTYGSRDLGAMASYRLPVGVPIKVSVGIFNGFGSNTPTWTSTFNVVSRIEYGHEDKGFGIGLSNLSGSTPISNRVIDIDGTPTKQDYRQKLRMWGAELRYIGRNFRVESEFAQRRLVDNNEKLNILNSAFVQGYYIFKMPTKWVAKTMYPTLRYDMITNLPFLSGATSLPEELDAQRITAGINFGFSPRFNGAELRLNYEKYFLNDKPSDWATSKLFHDKFTVEVVVAF